jgi:ABC-2 type transport system permease protein
MSRAIKPKRDMSKPQSGWAGIEERAPSVMRSEGPMVARYVAIFSLMLITVGTASVIFRANNRPYLIPAALGFFFLSVGIMGLLYHAFNETDFQFRRLYGFVGGLGLLGLGVVLRLLPQKNVVGALFLPYGAASLFLSLGFLLCFVRNEVDVNLRRIVLNLIGLAAAANILAGFIGGMISETFLLQTGVVHLIFGLLFGAAYVGIEGIDTQRGFWAGRGLGVAGGLMLVVALGRSFVPYLLFRYFGAARPQGAFFFPQGLILSYLGLEYLLLYLGICSDNKLVVLTRRELGAFFYSPIAYIVLIAMAALGGANYWLFLYRIFESAEGGPMGGGRGIPEPIFQSFVLSFLALIPLIFIVPVITMRMLSEEKRAGTLEVLLTAPVNEWQIVLAKFLAGLRIFMLSWYLWGIFLIALRVEGGQDFDYRPVITFMIALVPMGAGFIAMGLFFSSLTSHQIVAALFSFMVMFVSTLLFILMQYTGAESSWSFIRSVTYIDLWLNAARGTITLRLIVLHLAMATFWLFLTTKVLEARKWS